MAHSIHTSKRGTVSAVFGTGNSPGGSAKAETADASDSDLPSLSGLKTAELEAVATAEGVDLAGATNNAERRALIEAARDRQRSQGS